MRGAAPPLGGGGTSGVALFAEPYGGATGGGKGPCGELADC